MNKRYLLGIYLLVTLFSFMLFGIVHQLHRQSADQVAEKLARDAFLELSSGKSPEEIVFPPQIELSRSLSDPFLIVADSDGKIIRSSATLDNKPVLPPPGVFTHAKDTGESVVTWQPRIGERNAIVVRLYPVGDDGGTGFVIGGQSLFDTEDNIEDIGKLIVIGWLAGMLIVTVFFAPHPFHKVKK
jgi:hypothetical protein